MTIQDEIRELERRLIRLKVQQARCEHEWGETKYTPYTAKQERILVGQYETRSVDMRPRSVFDDVECPRWTRECKVCGVVQHTEKQADIPPPKRQAPDFGVQT